MKFFTVVDPNNAGSAMSLPENRVHNTVSLLNTSRVGGPVQYTEWWGGGWLEARKVSRTVCVI